MYHTESMCAEIPARKSFPEVVDNTMVKAYVECGRKFGYEFIQNLHPLGISVDLHAGKCFAKGLEMARYSYYFEHKSVAESEIAAYKAFTHAWGDFDSGDHVKSYARMLGALEFYFATFPLETDHLKPLVMNKTARIEFGFVVPIPEVLHPETGNPILFSGRTDMIAEHKAGGLYIEDDKTTKQLGPSWGQQWILSSQFMGYSWAARQYGYNIKGAIIRGISILKTKYGWAEEIVGQPEWKTDRWYKWFVSHLQRMIQDYESGYFDYAFGTACGNFGSCPFKLLCDTKEPEAFVANNYQHREWDPTNVKD